MRPTRIEPGPGQESVWDYPRPPRLEPCKRRVEAIFEGVVIAASDSAIRVLETAGPPTIYIPPDDCSLEHLTPTRRKTYCEWKGPASYFDVVVAAQRARNAAWSYPGPKPGFESIAGYLSFYPAKVECYLGGERARPQPGRFYGGWVTDDIVGPFKGEPGSLGW